MVASAAWGLLFLTDTLQMWHAVAILIVHGFAGVIIAPASQLILHDMVGAAQLHSAIRLNATSRYLAILLGPAVGGGLMLLLGPSWGLLTNVLIYVPFVIYLMRTPYTGRRVELRGSGRLPSGSVVAVFTQARAEPRLLTMIVLGAATSFFVGNAFQPQMPEYARRFGADHAGLWYSILLGGNAAGAVIGAILLESTAALRPSARGAILCAGVWAVAIGAFPLAPTYGVAVALLVVAGIFNIAFTSMAQTLVQVLAPAAIRGRMVGLFNTAMLGFRAGSGITVGVVGAVIGVHWSLMLSAAAVVVTVMALLARERAR